MKQDTVLRCRSSDLQCYSSFPLRLYAFLSFRFTVFPFIQVQTGNPILFLLLASRNLKYNNVRDNEYY